ncbi:MAG: hypothetical protein JSS42_12130 [Proteobacteria bacterium]|nr:hypothetical protein [Pseudomonadota bacterium]
MTRSFNLDFFALEADQKTVFDFLFSSTDVRVFESYSAFGSELREFRSTEKIASSQQLGTDAGGSGFALSLQLWSPSVMRDFTITKVKLDPSKCDGHTFRYRIDGGGLIQLYLGGLCERVVTKSHFGHRSQVRAQAWGADDGVDWKALTVLSNRIQYHVRKRLAAAKAGSMPVLPQALEHARAGYALKLAAQTPWSFDWKAE